MQNFREKYAYKTSLYFNLVCVIFVNFIIYFLNSLPFYFRTMVPLLFILFWVGFFLRLYSGKGLKKYLDLTIFIFGSFISFFLSLLSGFTNPLFCEFKGPFTFDCSQRGVLLDVLAAMISFVLSIHFYIFFIVSFASVILSVKYLMVLNEKENLDA